MKSDSKTGELAFFPFGNIEQRKFTATITYHVVFYLAFEVSFIANNAQVPWMRRFWQLFVFFWKEKKNNCQKTDNCLLNTHLTSINCAYQKKKHTSINCSSSDKFVFFFSPPGFTLSCYKLLRVRVHENSSQGGVDIKFASATPGDIYWRLSWGGVLSLKELLIFVFVFLTLYFTW